MARTTSISFHPCGLRYRSGQIVLKEPPKIMRFELADYPGYVDRVYLDPRFEEYVGVCPECGGRSSGHPSFTPAIMWLADHIFQGVEGCANSDSPRTPRRPVNHIANPGRNTTMRTTTQISRDLTAANTALDQLLARIARLNAEIEERAKLPDEPAVDHIAFEIQFAPGGIKYSYAAQRVGKVWYLTGRETIGKPWDEVLNFIAQDHRVQAGTRRLQFRELESGRVVKAAK